MAQQQRSDAQDDTPQQPQPSEEQRIPKPESSAEYEGADDSQPTGDADSAVKTETSSSSGQ